MLTSKAKFEDSILRFLLNYGINLKLRQQFKATAEW
jgi:hypothetical protein